MIEYKVIKEIEKNDSHTQRTLAEQFNLLRTVDNTRYPAFFDLQGHRYRLHIEKVDDQDVDKDART